MPITRQTERKDLEDVPEHVVLGGVEVVPEVPDVTRQPADDEDDDERQHQTSHLLTRLHLHSNSTMEDWKRSQISNPRQCRLANTAACYALAVPTEILHKT